MITGNTLFLSMTSFYTKAVSEVFWCFRKGRGLNPLGALAGSTSPGLFDDHRLVDPVETDPIDWTVGLRAVAFPDVEGGDSGEIRHPLEARSLDRTFIW
jgi:hypothetical protein